MMAYYGTGMLKTALKNRVTKMLPEENLEFHLNNIEINGVKRGCSGFIKNIETNITVYINTEPSCYKPLSDKVLYRLARDTKDFRGGVNRWGHLKNNAFITNVALLLCDTSDREFLKMSR